MASLWLITLLSSISPVAAFWRLPCGKIQLGRLDPIISPGTVAGHVHTISGPNNFDASSNNISIESAFCTSCPVQADKSAYWTPQLYYRYANGTFGDVGNGGTLVYYLDRGDDLPHMQPFPPGLRMVSGDPTVRSYDNAALTWSGKRPISDRVSFACINYNSPQPETPGLNNTNCPQGLRAQIHFQSCWDGQNTYKPDQSHVAYLDRIDNGACPPTHPVLLPHLFYELYYDVAHISIEDRGYYVFSQGDMTGYGFHGDFLNGWDTPVLTNAIAQCMGPNAVNDGGGIDNCPAFAASLDDNAGSNCPLQAPVVNETVTGLLTQLPGCNPPTAGPQRAPSQICPVQPNILATSNSSGTRSLPSPGNRVGDFAYVGCADVNAQALSGPSYSSASAMTIENCASFCRTNRFACSALSGGQQCNCGNTILSAINSNGTCPAPGLTCTGNIGQFCGSNGFAQIWNDTATTLSLKEMPQVGVTALDLNGARAVYSGCFQEPASGRAIQSAYFANTTGMSNEACGQFCQSKGFYVFGTEYAQECFCGTSISTPKASELDCTKPCTGDTTRFCGGNSRLSVWNITAASSSTSSQTTGRTTTTSQTSIKSATTTTTATTTTPTTALPIASVSGSTFVGCIHEPSSGRALNAGSTSSSSMTVEMCAQVARNNNFQYFGLEYGSECWYDSLINSGSATIPDSSCSFPCSGNDQQRCGASWILSVYNNTAYVPRIPISVQLSNSTFAYQGCFSDGNPRTLSGYSTSQSTMTVANCVQLCSSKGFTWAGVEYAQECYCANTLPGAASRKADSQCSMPCKGNSKLNCGGSNALQVYNLS